MVLLRLLRWLLLIGRRELFCFVGRGNVPCDVLFQRQRWVVGFRRLALLHRGGLFANLIDFIGQGDNKFGAVLLNGKAILFNVLLLKAGLNKGAHLGNLCRTAQRARLFLLRSVRALFSPCAILALGFAGRLTALL